MKYCLRFDDDALTIDSLSWKYIFVREDSGDNIHYHGYIENDLKISRTRKIITDNLKRRGNGAYSLKEYDEKKGCDYFQYMFKLDKEHDYDSFVSFLKVYNTLDWTMEQCFEHHKNYWKTNKTLKETKETTKRPIAFAKILVESFKNKYLNEFEMRYKTQLPSSDMSRLDFEQTRYEWLADVVMRELDAETKVFDEYIVKRFVLLLENRFNPGHIRNKIAKGVARNIRAFGEY